MTWLFGFVVVTSAWCGYCGAIRIAAGAMAAKETKTHDDPPMWMCWLVMRGVGLLAVALILAGAAGWLLGRGA